MEKILKEVKLNSIKINDDFWGKYQNLVTNVVIPYQEKILNDEVDGAEKSHAFSNFRIAAKLEKGDFYGMVFQDSDVAKWLEAVAYSLSVSPDSELEERADEIIEIISKAQQEDGYLDTYFIIKEPEHRWKNLLEGHELYCMGHMMEAAVAYYEVTGKTTLLAVAEKMTNQISDVFGDGKQEGIPGHEEIEIGLLKMFRATGNEKYLKIAEYFINQRGQSPDFFADEEKKRNFTIFNMNPYNTLYNQSFAPVREQKSAEGHAVRAVYLYRAMADLAAITNDAKLYTACKNLWNNICEKKMYITGAIGASGELESFSKDYDLPGDRAYAETCAQVGMVFWAKSMLDIEPKGEYADIMERCLYNSTISGMQLDGKHFFYVNPLEVNPGISGEVFGMKHVLPERTAWYQCACCPPNLARMIASIGKYCWSENEDTVYSHLMIGQTADLSNAEIKIESRYPWEGKVTYMIKPKKKMFTFALHIPSYVKENELVIRDDGKVIEGKIKDGYLYITKNWEKNEKIELTFPMKIFRIYSTVRVLDTIGKTALMRGPIVYCIEGVDNGEEIQALLLPRNSEIRTYKEEMGILKGTISLLMDGVREIDSDKLYTDNPPKTEKVQIKAIPYYIWGNRGQNQMRVWIRETV